MSGSVKYSDGEPLTAAMNNVLAWRLGKVFHRVLKNGTSDVGDHIDAGLILHRFLEEHGFEIREM